MGQEAEQIEGCLRQGDVYATLIEAYVGQNNFQAAYEKLEEMKKKRIDRGPYIDADILTKVQKEVGFNLVDEPEYATFDNQGAEAVDEEIDEELDESLDE